jgi:hypothetical protein
MWTFDSFYSQGMESPSNPGQFNPQHVLAALQPQVARAQREQLAEAQVRVGEDADDQLVALGLRGVLQLLDLVAAQRVQNALAHAGQLAAGAAPLTLGSGPRQERVDRSHVAMDGRLGDCPLRPRQRLGEWLSI